ncbi:hypothetical protein [Peristeroidobacter soli]|jgi:hypothetical protein|uniref:hypothetical protein n=1 Tax=Peristeroidobacter soli TaxID=2497877 RepID=UPI00101C203D|nr:hypothetical protein [Peristeroidobacter soli]
MTGKLVCSLGIAVGLFVTNSARADEFPSVSLSAMTIGVLGPTDLGLQMLEARAAVSSYLHLTAAPTLVIAEGGNTEQQLRTAATFFLDLGTIRIDDRNLGVFSDAGTMRYRNRIRLTQPANYGGYVVRWQLLDEAFYEKGGPGWFRNMWGAGLGVDAGSAVSVDAYWLQQDDDGKRTASLLLLMLTVHLL